MNDEAVIAVVIPCYRVRNHILGVIAKIGDEVQQIYVVDDCCPDHSGDLVEECCKDHRVRVIRNAQNVGVGGAVIAGYEAAISAGADVIVKIDGDGQMNPELIKDFVAPILTGEADYTKGNRFFYLSDIRAMPKLRLFGNAVLSFITKISSGYWHLFDPTNGYTAIHAHAAKHLELSKISSRYFFESDMLFRLNIIRAVVVDVPMTCVYGSEVSSLKISSIVFEFLWKNLRNFAKRIFYNYYLRDLSLASVELPIGLLLFLSGCAFGTYHWVKSLYDGVTTPAGTVMLAALPILIGLQLLLAFIGYDVASTPTRPLHSMRLGLYRVGMRRVGK